MTRVLSTAVLATALILPAMTVQADTSDKRIALSNNYAGNSWRQAMLKSWEKVGSAAVEEGVIAAADPFTTAENQVTEQAAQIQNLILQGYDAIVVNAASPDALNGAVIRLAANYKLAVPHNSVVYNIVKFIEAKTR